jgi:methyl-accepting chemotaxis protein
MRHELDSLPASGAPPWRARLQPARLAAGGATLAGIGLAWFGGPAGVLGAAAAAAALWWGLGGSTAAATAPPAGAVDDAAPSDDGGHRRGAELMMTQVVPVWQRQMLATREVADSGLSQLLEAFSGFSGSLDSLAGQLGSSTLAASPGAVDTAVQGEGTALGALLAPSRRAFVERDAAVAELGRCADAMSELQQLVKQAREIARHTRLVAFNAAIEAQRSGNPAGGGGSQAVANEVRMLAGRMTENAEQIDRLATGLHKGLAGSRRQGEISDTSPEELKMEIELRAREALNALMTALGASLQGSAAVQQASSQLRSQIDDAFVHFQFGDRVSQMLAILGNDMHNLVRWVSVNPYATQSDAAEWLAALEASYTTDEQRAEHHGNTHIESSGEAEFF